MNSSRMAGPRAGILVGQALVSTAIVMACLPVLLAIFLGPAAAYQEFWARNPARTAILGAVVLGRGLVTASFAYRIRPARLGALDFAMNVAAFTALAAIRGGHLGNAVWVIMVNGIIPFTACAIWMAYCARKLRRTAQRVGATVLS